MTRLCDAHTHFVTDEDLRLREKRNILSLMCFSTPEDIDAFLCKQVSDIILPTCGIHPWSADQYQLSDMEKYMNMVPVIGEIGMDNVWCDVPLNIQQKRFEEQLEFASSIAKPVILHTKGQEKEIATLIRKYPNRYLVHWYSCSEYLDEYIEQDCFFSVGPDVWWNPATENVARKVPLDRILTETDGLSAVEWAYNEAPDTLKPLMQTIPDTTEKALKTVLNSIADIRELSVDSLQEKISFNLKKRFLHMD